MSKAKDKPAATPAPEEGVVAVVEQGGAVALNDALDFSGDIGAGLETFGTRDLAVPFLAILQKNSPQVDEDNGKYVDGAKTGMIFNTVTGQIFPKETGVEVIPCAYRKQFVEWTPREQGGGFIASHDENSAFVREVLASGRKNEKGIPLTEGGNTLVETAYHHVLLVTDEGYSWAIISMTSSQLKASRKWNSLVAGLKVKTAQGMRTPPMFASRFRLSTSVRTKDEFTFYGWDIEALGLLGAGDRDLYEAAKDYYKAVSEGAVKANPPAEDAVEGEAEGASKKDVPF